jgi:hypothetical protein
MICGSESHPSAKRTTSRESAAMTEEANVEQNWLVFFV